MSPWHLSLNRWFWESRSFLPRHSNTISKLKPLTGRISSNTLISDIIMRMCYNLHNIKIIRTNAKIFIILLRVTWKINKNVEAYRLPVRPACFPALPITLSAPDQLSSDNLSPPIPLSSLSPLLQRLFSPSRSTTSTLRFLVPRSSKPVT